LERPDLPCKPNRKVGTDKQMTETTVVIKS
jgi:hypothetical protein